MNNETGPYLKSVKISNDIKSHKIVNQLRILQNQHILQLLFVEYKL